ncbi:MAG: carbamoyl phosphate synthase small subunit [Oscillospiraceae bacterium]|nr:carbamoyl phosphate synthase small subunit [Oscillospiraceae bacterium]
MKTAYLILENGAVFEGFSFGYEGEVTGEVVFATGMSGYLETLTDPSYFGQIILQTFPLIGNYGVIPADFESAKIGAKGYIVKRPCQNPSNFRNEGVLDTFLKERKIPGLCGIDTRALTRVIREGGVMNGKITLTAPTESDREQAKSYRVINAVSSVSSSEIAKLSEGLHRIALLDFGAKRGIAAELIARDCEVWNFPYNATFEEIMQVKPHGIMLSNGPGDPAEPSNSAIVEVIKKLQNSGLPMFGICLGHQLLAMANNYKTRKLKFGHRGANQPVKDVETGRVFITSQNHGYAVIAENSAFVNVNDGSCEGLEYDRSFSVQFHPEARGGPLDTNYLFDKFLGRVKNAT